jgi:hypothetical protein
MYILTSLIVGCETANQYLVKAGLDYYTCVFFSRFFNASLSRFMIPMLLLADL